MLTWPMASIGWVTSIIQRAAASQKRINEMLNTSSSINKDEGKHLKIEGKITFANVNFTYPENDVTALKNISFSVEKGQSIAIVGRTGSGKSSIIQLLTKTYLANSGTITIDDEPIENINIECLRDTISLVPQEALLFSDTIANNIAFGSKKKLPISEIEQAAKQASVHENISGFPLAYDTMVGERGVTLSGGQKQRISIARAFIKPSSIVLLDDCLSAVDNETEENILNEIKQNNTNKTSIIISHRLSSIKHVDFIIVLEKGSIVEIGSHDQLMKKESIYFDMYNQQLHSN